MGGKVTVSAGSLLFPKINKRLQIEFGSSILDIVTLAGIPEASFDFVRATINGDLVPNHMWAKVKPRLGSTVNIGVLPANSETGRMIVPLALSFAAQSVSGPAGWALQLGAIIVGTFIGNALFPIGEDKEVSLLSITSAGNKERKYSCVPKIYGKLRVYPPIAAMAQTEISGDDQYVKVLLAVGYKPLNITDIRIGDKRAINDRLGDIQIAVDSGYGRSYNTPISSIFTNAVSETILDREMLYVSSWNAQNGRTIRTGEEVPENVISFVTAENTTAVSIDFEFPDGLWRGDSEDPQGETVSYRIRYRHLYASDDIGLESRTNSSWRWVRPIAESTIDVTYPDETKLFAFLVELNERLDDLYALLSGVALVQRIVSNILAAFIRVRMDELDEVLLSRQAVGNLTVEQQAAIDSTTQRLIDLRDVLGTASEVTGRVAGGINTFNAILSLVIEAIDFASDCMRMSDYLNDGNGPPLESLPLWQQFICHLRGEERFFQDVDEETFIVHTTNRSINPFRKNVTFPVSEGQYEVQIGRVSRDIYTREGGVLGIGDHETDTIDTDVHNEIRVNTVRSIKSGPILSDWALENVATIAMRIKATDEYNNSIDQINCIAESALTWSSDGVAFQGPNLERSSNPAWIVYDMLTGIATGNKVPSTHIDMTRLMEFASLCSGYGYEFHGAFDDQTTLQDALRTVAKVARSTILERDGKISIIMDKPLPEGTSATPVTIISGRNSSGYSITKAFGEMTQAYQAKFLNEDKNWQQDTINVYDDIGDTSTRYTDNNPPVNKPKEISFIPGITNADKVDAMCRYLIACEKLRPESHTLVMDMENIVFELGDVVTLQHDVPMWGIGSARIATISYPSTGPARINMTIDDDPTQWSWENGRRNKIRIRCNDGTQLEFFVYLLMDNVTLEASLPISGVDHTLISVGDLTLFSYLPFENCMVREIKPQSNRTAEIVLVSHAPEVHIQGDIPEFNSNITEAYHRELIAPPKPVISSVQADERAIIRKNDGALQTNILIGFDKPSQQTNHDQIVALQVQKRYSPYFPGQKPDEAVLASKYAWEYLPTHPADLGYAYISDVRERFCYDIRMRFVTRYGIPSDWTAYNYIYVTGKTNPPPDIKRVYFDRGKLSWDYDPPIDHAGFVVRQTYGTAGSWESSAEMHKGVITATEFDVSKIDGGFRTFFVKAVDTSGNYSKMAVSVTNEYGKWRTGEEVSRAAVGSDPYPEETYSDVLYSRGRPIYRGASSKFYTSTYPKRIKYVGSITPFGINSMVITKGIEHLPNINIFPDLDITGDAPYSVEVRNGFRFLWPEDMNSELWPSGNASMFWPPLGWEPMTSKISVTENDFTALQDSLDATLDFRVVVEKSDESITFGSTDIVIDAEPKSASYDSVEYTVVYPAFLPQIILYGWNYIKTASVTLSNVSGQNPLAKAVVRGIINSANPPFIDWALFDEDGDPLYEGLVDITITGF